MRHFYSPTPGEYVVGLELERRRFSVYLPTKNAGVDLLVGRDGRYLALQVKECRTFPHPEDSPVEWTAWTDLKREDVIGARERGVDVLVFVVYAPASLLGRLRFRPIFVVIPPGELERRLAAYRPTENRTVYWYRPEDGRLWEVGGRTLKASPPFRLPERDFTAHLNAWDLLDPTSRPG